MTRPRATLLNTPGLEDWCRRGHMQPSADLAPFVAAAWTLEWDLEGRPPYTQRIIPNPCAQIVVDATGAHAIGVFTGPYAHTFYDRGFVFGLRFRPGGFHPFTRTPLAALRDRRLPLTQVIPGVDEGELRRRAMRADSQGILDVLEAALREAAAGADPLGEQTRVIAERIGLDSGLMTVSQVAGAFRLPTRTLQRLFRTYVGINPKWMIRQCRLQEAAARVEAGEVRNWTDLALRLGYYDQAHFVNDFTRAVGSPPAEYLRAIG